MISFVRLQFVGRLVLPCLLLSGMNCTSQVSYTGLVNISKTTTLPPQRPKPTDTLPVFTPSATTESVAKELPVVDKSTAQIKAKELTFQIRASHERNFTWLQQQASRNPKICSALRGKLAQTDKDALTPSERAYLEEISKEPCTVFSKMMQTEPKQEYIVSQIPKLDPVALKTISSCQTYRGILGDVAARKLKERIEKEKNVKKLKQVLEKQVPCLGTIGAYLVNYQQDNIDVLLTEKIGQFSNRNRTRATSKSTQARKKVKK